MTIYRYMACEIEKMAGNYRSPAVTCCSADAHA